MAGSWDSARGGRLARGRGGGEAGLYAAGEGPAVLQCLPGAAALEAHHAPEERLREVAGREHQALGLDPVQELAAGLLGVRKWSGAVRIRPVLLGCCTG